MLAFILLVIFSSIFLVSSETAPFINLTKITFTRGIDSVKFEIDLEGYKSKISCTDCSIIDKLSYKCTKGGLAKVSLSLVSETVYYLVPFNISCDASGTIVNTISNITSTTTNTTAVRISWNLSDKNVTKYVIYFMDEYQFHHKLANTNSTSYVMDIPRETKWYQICIATVNDNGSMSIYNCQKLFYVPPLLPVSNLKVSVSSLSAIVTWEKSTYTEKFHHGYVVNLTSPSGVCKTTVINMKPFCVSTKNHCSYPTIVRWPSLVPLRLDNLVSNTKYVVSVAALSVEQISLTKNVAFTTEFQDLALVDKLEASIQDNYMFIQFQYPIESESAVVKFILKVVLLRVNMCTYKQRIIHNELINLNSKMVNVDCLTNCCEYFIEVTPVKICNDVIEKNGTAAIIIFKPKFKTSDPLMDVNAQILSNNILKVNWSNTIHYDNCANFGFVVQIYRSHYCKTWIISTKSCSELERELTTDMLCSSNREYLKINDGVVQKHLLLTGEFKVNSIYGVKIWRFTEKIDVIYHKEIKYSDGLQCFNDCYASNYSGISAVAINSQICKPWKDFSQFPQNGSYRANLCYLDKKFGLVPMCIHNLKGNLMNCSIPPCPHGSNNIPCIRSFMVLHSSTSVTIQWQLPTNTIKPLNGYITLLYNTNWQCQRYQIQLRADTINLLNMGAALQSFLLSCPSGSISYTWTRETKFDYLKPNEEYVVNMIPLVNSETYGELSRINIATKVSESVSPNYMTIKTERNSIHIALTQSQTENTHAVRQMVRLMKNNQIEVASAIINKQVVELQNLDICTVYCAYVSSVYMLGYSSVTDKACVRTPAPEPSKVEIMSIESGPNTTRVVSWKYFGNDDCEKNYVLQYVHKFFTGWPREITTSKDKTNYRFEALEIGLILQVKAKTQMVINIEKKITNSEWSSTKEFYVGELNPKLSNVSVSLDTTKKNLRIGWSLYGTSKSAFFQYLIRVENNGECIQTITLSCAVCNSILKLDNVQTDIKTTFLELSRCNETRNQMFRYDSTLFDLTMSTNKTKINGKINIYGLNLIGLLKVFGTSI